MDLEELYEKDKKINKKTFNLSQLIWKEIKKQDNFYGEKIEILLEIQE